MMKHLLFLILLLSSTNIFAEGPYCRKPMGIEEIQSIKLLCKEVLKSTVCKNVPKNDLKNCDQSNSLEMSWEAIAGCAKGTLNSIESIWDFLKSIMVWIGETITLQTEWKKISDTTKTITDSSALYLKNEYMKHFQEAYPPFQKEKALLNMGASIGKLISNAATKYFEEKSLVFKNCLSVEAQSKVTCEFIANIFLPPAAAISLLKYGPRAISNFKNMASAAEKAEKMIPEMPREFHLKAREIVDRKGLDATYIHFSPTSTAQNERWINLAKSGKTTTYVEVENSALKRLNDQLGDKNLVTALTNFHKDLLFEAMEKFSKQYPDLEMLKYSDFKSSRFAFNKELSPKQLEELNELIKNVNSKFARDISKIDLGTKLKNENIAGWFSSGIGKTADQAGLASRESRLYARNHGIAPTPTVSFDQIRSKLGEHASLMESTRLTLVRNIEAKATGAKILETIPGTNQKGLSREAFEALRKGDEDAIKIFREKYGITFSESERRMLIEYYHGVDKLAPGIWIKERTVANLDDAEVGGFSADFVGMGAANIHQVSVDLAKSKGSVEGLIRQIREGEGLVTKEFELKKTGFENQVNETMKRLGQQTELKCSGDDCVSLVRQSLNLSKKKEIVSDLMNKLGPSSIRLSFIPPGVPKALRTKIAVAGEAIEKELRKRLSKIDGTGIDPNKMKDVMLAIDMPKGVKGDQVNLVIGMKTKETLTPAEVEVVQKYFKQVMKDMVGKIDYGDGIIPNYQSGQTIIVRN
ncbi:MAG: hypothetical protein Fur0010_12310 [Bdellovibrio sp.]